MLELELEETRLESSLKTVRPFSPPQVSVTLPLHDMLQRPSVASVAAGSIVSPQ